MKKAFINEAHIEGLLYDTVKLVKKVSGPNSKNPGTEFISGTVCIATDDKLENVVNIHYTYVTATTGKGNPNATFAALNKIITDNPTVLNVGKENAAKVRCDTSVDLLEWYRETTDEKPVSIVRNEGGFMHIVTALNEDEKVRNTFKTDMLITNVKDIEADEDKKIEAHVRVKGAVFNFRKELKPVEFDVYSKGGMSYFQNLDASPKHPVFTCVWGREMSKTVVTKSITESAFGEDEVRERTNTTREFVITGCSKEPYAFDDESTITAAELSQLMSDRELYLATLKKSQEEWRQLNAGGSAAAAPSNDTAGYNF